MASRTATIVANDLANHYVVGSKNVGVYRKMNPDYVGYVHNIAPVLDDLLTVGNSVMAERKRQGLPTW